VGIIYESRPNVTVDSAVLCLRAANACILRGGKEAVKTNTVLVNLIAKALKETGLPEKAVILVIDPERDKILQLLKAVKYVDLIIPRGGEALIKYVTENSAIPVIKHDKGVCNIYVDEAADFGKAIDIVYNAKTSYPGACNAVECVLVHNFIAKEFLPMLYEKFFATGVKLYGCARSCRILDIAPVTEWGAEYLSLELAVRVVDSFQDAVEHIREFGSAHSDAIITEDYTTAELFLSKVDSDCVYVNASTRFTDGGQFGLGAEVGISTQKLHARGPMGAKDLTTYKYIIYGSGQVRE
jgi:glutamate-5-semialdehyde dehydrogenase